MLKTEKQNKKKKQQPWNKDHRDFGQITKFW